MRMVVPSIAISCNSTTPATPERASTRRPPAASVICRKAPVAFWPGTVARTQASLTATWASAGAAARVRSVDRVAVVNRRFMVSFLEC